MTGRISFTFSSGLWSQRWFQISNNHNHHHHRTLNTCNRTRLNNKVRSRKRYNYYETFSYYENVIHAVSLILLLTLFSSIGISSGDSSSRSNNNHIGDSSILKSDISLSSSSSSSSSTSSSTNGASSASLLSAGEPSFSSSSSSTVLSNSALEDNLRKELIKVQILQRLGLTEKPQVDLAHKISRDLVLETLRRTETLDEVEGRDGGPILTTNRFQHHRRHNNQSRFGGSSSSDGDDGSTNYAKTSEIISFPEKGPELNGETLLSFSFAGTNAFGVGVRVKKAHLWVKIDHMSPIGRQLGHLIHPRGVILYIFQIQGNFTHLPKPPQFLRTQDVNFDLVISKVVSLDSLGWQKLDVTDIVQKWYSKISRHKVRHGHGATVSSEEGKNSKLTLLVDCSGCGDFIHPITFTRPASSSFSASSSSFMSSSNIANETDSDNELGTERKHQQVHHHHHYNNQHINSSSKLSHAAAGFDSFPDDDLGRGNSSSTDDNNDHLDNLSEIPFLVLETETTSPNIKRSRRRALECNPRVKQCCKQRFFISFAELGWQDWIIAPRGYYANYCRGHCGGVHRTPDTFLNYHTHVMEEYRRTAAGEAELNGITPCCAPTKFAAMSLIYFGPELNIIKRDLPKMIIEECGCP